MVHSRWCEHPLNLNAVDYLAQSHQIPITNPVDGHTFASVLLVSSATLSTTNPVDRGREAPKGMMYLSLQMTSNPPELEYPDPNWGSYFSSMTPLSASAIRYVAKSGHSYSVVRADPINQANNVGVYGDGLVNAVYYFTVPLESARHRNYLAHSHNWHGTSRLRRQ